MNKVQNRPDFNEATKRLFVLSVLLFIILANIFYWIDAVGWWRQNLTLGFGYDILEGRITVLSVHTAGKEAGFRVGDQVVGVNGRGVSPNEGIGLHLNLETGLVNRYLVRRDGRALQLDVAVSRPKMDELTFFLLPWLVGVAYLAIGAIAYLLKPLRSTWAFWLFCLFMGLTLNFRIVWEDSEIYWLSIWVFAIAFTPAAMIHLALSFPEKRGFAKGRPLYLYLPYLPSLLIFTLYLTFFLVLKSPEPFWLNILPWLYLGLSGVAFLISLMYNYIKASSPLGKQRARLVLIGIILTSPPLIWMGLVNLFSRVILPVDFKFVSPFFVIFPLTIAYAILRYKLFDINPVIRRSLVYTILTGLITGLYALAIALFNLLFSQLEIYRLPLLSLVFMVVLVILFNPLRVRVQNLVGRLFFKKGHDYRKLLKETSEVMASTLSSQEISEYILEVVDDVARPERAILLLKDDETDSFSCAGGIPVGIEPVGDNGKGVNLTIDGDDHLIKIALKRRREISRLEIEEEVESNSRKKSLVKRLDELGSHLIIPLIHKDKVKGILSLGNPPPGDLYTEGDVGFLIALANQGIMAIENARLTEKLLTSERENAERLAEENRELREKLSREYNFENIVGKSKAMEDVFMMIGKVAETSATVLIRGESGTGKELVARAIHSRSQEQERTFLSINCAAIPKDLLESELFGHERGAFTGALANKKGKFELADGGTLFLDEIGDMSLDTQVKLLRVLQEKEFERVGGTKTIKVDIRLLAATNQNLEKKIQDGSFREDLYYRLNVVSVFVPSLRERKEDIPFLADYFLEKYNNENDKEITSIQPAIMKALTQYDWPGNVRELENAIERAVILARSRSLALEDMPLNIQKGNSAFHQERGDTEESQLSLKEELEQYEKIILTQALQHAGWNKTKAARSLGINRNQIRYLVSKYELEETQD